VRISTLISRLQEAQDRFGDLPVVVGERSSLTASKIDVNVRQEGVTCLSQEDDGTWERKVAIVQAYHIFK
jgi:hypothetical protein